jgi:hypothetical protein
VFRANGPGLLVARANCVLETPRRKNKPPDENSGLDTRLDSVERVNDSMVVSLAILRNNSFDSAHEVEPFVPFHGTYRTADAAAATTAQEGWDVLTSIEYSIIGNHSLFLLSLSLSLSVIPISKPQECCHASKAAIRTTSYGVRQTRIGRQASPAH